MFTQKLPNGILGIWKIYNLISKKVLSIFNKSNSTPEIFA